MNIAEFLIGQNAMTLKWSDHMKRNLALSACISGVLLAPSAIAATFNTIGDSQIVNFNGFINEIVQPGLTGKLTYTLNLITRISPNASVEATEFEFTVNIMNTSSTPITASRISGFGFNTNPDVKQEILSAADSTTIIAETTASGIFEKVHIPGTFPQNVGGDVHICVNDGNNCQGGGGTGVTLGNSADITLTLAFAGNVEAVDLSNYRIRFQSIEGCNTEEDCGDSGVGQGSEVPVPAAAWLFGSGLIGLAGIARKRRA